MKCTAVLKCDSKNPAAVSASIAQDNDIGAGVTLITEVVSGQVVSTVVSENLMTTLSCIDDILICQCSAEGAV
jgi:hypothetical protein